MHEFVEQRLAPREQRDFRAHFAESDRDIATDPARRTRDEHHAIVKISTRLGIRRIVVLLCQAGAGCPRQFGWMPAAIRASATTGTCETWMLSTQPCFANCRGEVIDVWTEAEVQIPR
jgi:hypothetical protein